MTAPAPRARAGVRSPGDPELAHLRAFVTELAAAGLRHVCISPGARSTPLTVSLTHEPRIRCWSHVDERSNAFFALGIAKATRTPTAVVCTSGTAAANFFPAVIEATHSNVPLLVLTGDRPPELRDCEAGQTIDQIKLYGGYPKWFAEVGMADCGPRYFRSLARRAVREATQVPAGVVHLNFPLREPLIATAADRAVLESGGGIAAAVVTTGAPSPAEEDVARLAALIKSKPRGLVVCGTADFSEETAETIAALAARCQFPILADPTSQLRRSAHADVVVDSYDSLLASEPFASDLHPDLVLRLGGLPVCKPLRLWLERCAVPQIVIDANGRWNDPIGTAAEIWPTDSSATCRALLDRLDQRTSQNANWSRAWFEANRRARRAKDAAAGRSKILSGVGLFARLARLMPDRSTVYVGNSLPIRQMEAIWPAEAAAVRVLCNRGANGIDGVVSSVLGAAAVSSNPVVGVLGDLSFYHDLNGLLAGRRHPINATFIVANNDGGGIFSMLPQSQLDAIFDEYFTTPHGLDFSLAAEMYGCTFDRIESWQHFDEAVSRALSSQGTNVIELPIDTEQDLAVTRDVIHAGAEAAAPLTPQSSLLDPTS